MKKGEFTGFGRYKIVKRGEFLCRGPAVRGISIFKLSPSGSQVLLSCL